MIFQAIEDPRQKQRFPASRVAGLTRQLAGIPLKAALFATRGFSPASPQAQETLEGAALAFVRGYNLALEVADPLKFVDAFHPDERERIGFFMEGAAMGVGIRDGMPWHVFSKARMPLFLETARADHPYLSTVGAGWAMARLPWRRTEILASLDRLLAPLALDGWGFHDCYFGRARIGKGVPHSLAKIAKEHGIRSWDQGAGRALWFISGGDVHKAIANIEMAPPARRSDLYAGLGLAVTYAGGFDFSAMGTLLSSVGPHRRDLAQGAAFALEAHIRASTGHPQLLSLSTALTGRIPSTVVSMVRSLMPVPLGHSIGASSRSWLLYEEWRLRVARELEEGWGAR